MFKSFREYFVRLLLAPLAAHFRVQAAIEVAECKAEMLRRAQQAEEENQPELARQLREHAATLTLDAEAEHLPAALPAPSANGSVAALPAPKKAPGRPKKEDAHEVHEAQR